jgi:uncharacterized protein (DUF2062 family)
VSLFLYIIIATTSVEYRNGVIFSNEKVITMITQLYTRIRQFIKGERCPRKLSFSVAISVFIAFSPFVGFHTLMAFAFAWFFALNVGILLALSNGINNPWTMLPIYATDHVVGDNILSWLGIDSMQLNPNWISALNDWLFNHTGIQGLKLWSFLIGGNLLSVLLALIIYPIVRYILAYRAQGV